MKEFINALLHYIESELVFEKALSVPPKKWVSFTANRFPSRSQYWINVRQGSSSVPLPQRPLVSITRITFALSVPLGRAVFFCSVMFSPRFLFVESEFEYQYIVIWYEWIVKKHNIFDFFLMVWYNVTIIIWKRGDIMPKRNIKQTSHRVASIASKVLRDGRTSKASKTTAGSALSQSKSPKK